MITVNGSTESTYISRDSSSTVCQEEADQVRLSGKDWSIGVLAKYLGGFSGLPSTLSLMRCSALLRNVLTTRGWYSGCSVQYFSISACQHEPVNISNNAMHILLEVTLRNNLGQVVYTYVPLSPSSITWYWPKGGDTLQLGR